MMAFVYLLVILSIAQTSGLDNGLARTPPMGWLSWERFGCNTDCVNYPESCIGERLYMDMADRLAADGYREAGYQYVNIDDCWTEMERGENMNLVPSRSRFPHGIKYLADYPPYSQIADTCNIWRNFKDIRDTWDSVMEIIEFYGDDQGNFSSVARPGAFNDPDMLIVGDPGLSPDQEKVQMAMWSIMAAPLFMSNDLRNIRNSSRDILLNKGAISINQDKLGIMAKRRWKSNNIEGWSRPVMPKGSYAIAILNLGQGGDGQNVDFKLEDLAITGTGTFELTEVFTGESLGMYNATSTVVRYVDESSVFFGKLTLQ